MSLPQISHYNVNLHVLSPIHVGTGQELDPFSYIIQDRMLLLIDLIQWMETYPEKEKLYSMMDSDNFANIRSFIAENFNTENAVCCAIPVDSPKLLETYKKTIQHRDPRNQVLISPMTRNEISMEAYIPGSSIKGAIRTAIANHFIKIAGITSKDSGGKNDYNQKIFGQINKDPMRWLKLSDVSLGSSSTVIVESKEYPLNPDKPLTPKGHMEVSFSLCYTGRATVYPLRFSMAPFELHGTRIDPPFIADALYRFYVSKYEAEYKNFFQSQRAEDIQQRIVPMNQVIAGLRTNETLIRIGHFSHVECITLDHVRKPRTRKGKDGRPLPWGKTRTLANGIHPFGWAKLEFTDLPSEPRPERKWGLLLKGTPSVFPGASLAAARQALADTDSADQPSDFQSALDSQALLEKLHSELELIKANDMGRIGTIIQKIEELKTDDEKAEIAAAIRDKIGPKAFKKHKQKNYLASLIEMRSH